MKKTPLHLTIFRKFNTLLIFNFSLVSITLFLGFFVHLHAANVTLTWSPNSESDLAGYRIYKRILPSSDYGGPIFSGWPSNPSSPSKVISSLPADKTLGFVITAFDTSGNESAPSQEKQITLSSPCTPPSPAESIKINFQPTTASIPSGYIKDDGSAYTSCRGYGWTTTLTSQTHDRNANSDQRLDTFVFSNPNTASTWNLDLPNGNYLVSLASGDASVNAGPITVILEGLPLFYNRTTNRNTFLSFTNLPITVTDGNLTITLGAASGSSLLNFIAITPS